MKTKKRLVFFHVKTQDFDRVRRPIVGLLKDISGTTTPRALSMGTV